VPRSDPKTQVGHAIEFTACTLAGQRVNVLSPTASSAGRLPTRSPPGLTSHGIVTVVMKSSSAKSSTFVQWLGSAH
jgi:hypothetical protein